MTNRSKDLVGDESPEVGGQMFASEVARALRRRRDEAGRTTTIR
jgi:hypothetical protein